MILYYYFCSLSGIIPAIISLKYWKRMMDSKFNKWYLSFILYRFLEPIITIILEEYLGSSYPAFHLTVVLDGLFYIALARSLSSIPTRYLQLMQVGIVGIAAMEIWMTQSLFINNWYATVFTYLIVIIIYFSLFFKSEAPLIYSQKVFVIAVFSYYTALYCYFIFENMIRSNLNLFVYLQPMVLTLTFIFNLTITYTIFKLLYPNNRINKTQRHATLC